MEILHVKPRKRRVLDLRWPFLVGVLFSLAGLLLVTGASVSAAESELYISSDFVSAVKNEEVSVKVKDGIYSLDEVGITGLKKQLADDERVSARQVVVGMGSYEIILDSKKFANFVNKLNELYSQPARDAQLVSDGINLKIIDEGKGTKYVSDSVWDQIVVQLDDEKTVINIEPDPVLPDINSGDLAQSQVLLYRISGDVFVVNGKKTVDITRGDILKMLKFNCKVAAENCGEQFLPCVDESRVKDYVNSGMSELLKVKEVYEIASNKKGSFEYESNGQKPDLENLAKQIVNILDTRIEQVVENNCDGVLGDASVSEIKIKNKEVAGTDGTYADRYIEIDDSQQHIYVWEKGEMIMDFEMSGFFEKYAVFGVFEIREKHPQAWSSIAEKWMPYWMAYYYDPVQQAWYGIHELVWWDDDDGVRHVEGSDSIGQRKSGGCIRLDRGEAEKLYSWAKVGEVVLIHP